MSDKIDEILKRMDDGETAYEELKEEVRKLPNWGKTNCCTCHGGRRVVVWGASTCTTCGSQSTSVYD